MSKVQNRHALKVQLVDDAEKFQNKNAIKVKVEGGGGGTIDVDDELSTTSKNPVQNKVITAAVNGKQDTLTAGENITIENNVISASGGGGDSTYAVYADYGYNDNVGFVINGLYKDEEMTIPFTAADLLQNVDSRYRVYITRYTNAKDALLVNTSTDGIVFTNGYAADISACFGFSWIEPQPGSSGQPSSGFFERWAATIYVDSSYRTAFEFPIRISTYTVTYP